MPFLAFVTFSRCCQSRQVMECIRRQPFELGNYLQNKILMSLLLDYMVGMVTFCSFFLELWMWIHISQKSHTNTLDILPKSDIPESSLVNIMLQTLTLLLLFISNIIHHHTQFWHLRRNMRLLQSYEINDQLAQTTLLILDFLHNKVRIYREILMFFLYATGIFCLRIYPSKEKNLNSYIWSIILLTFGKKVLVVAFSCCQFWFPIVLFGQNFTRLRDMPVVGADPREVPDEMSIMEIQEQIVENSQNTEDESSEITDVYGADQCTICITDFDPSDRVRKLRCGHVFHTQCIDPWFRRRSTCPLCKDDINEIHV